jgi:hypothetical protein
MVLAYQNQKTRQLPPFCLHITYFTMPSKRSFKVLDDRELIEAEINKAAPSKKRASSLKNVRNLVPTDAFPPEAIPLLQQSTPEFEPTFQV